MTSRQIRAVVRTIGIRKQDSSPHITEEHSSFSAMVACTSWLKRSIIPRTSCSARRTTAKRSGRINLVAVHSHPCDVGSSNSYAAPMRNYEVLFGSSNTFQVGNRDIGCFPCEMEIRPETDWLTIKPWRVGQFMQSVEGHPGTPFDWS